jgi:hypothetical protein
VILTRLRTWWSKPANDWSVIAFAILYPLLAIGCWTGFWLKFFNGYPTFNLAPIVVPLLLWGPPIMGFCRLPTFRKRRAYIILLSAVYIALTVAPLLLFNVYIVSAIRGYAVYP